MILALLSPSICNEIMNIYKIDSMFMYLHYNVFLFFLVDVTNVFYFGNML